MKKLSFALLVVLFSHIVNAQNLMELYNLAKKTDPKFLAAQATRQSAHQSEKIAAASLQPNVSLSGNATYFDQNVRRSSLNSTDQSFNSSDLTLNITQPLYRRDRWLSLDQARQQGLKSDADLAVEEQDLMIRLANAYFGVLGEQDALAFVKADKKAIARQLDQARQRFEVGLIAITAVHEAQAAYDQVLANEIDTENRLDNAREALREIVGDLDFELNNLTMDLEMNSPKPSDLDQWTTISLANNPSILSAQKAAEAARLNIAIQRSGHYPSLDLVGAYAVSDSNARVSSDTDTLSVGLQLSVPLYSGGSVTASTEQAQYDFESARLRVDQQQRAVTRQVRNAYRGVISSIGRVKALEASQVSTRSAMEATEAGFEVGTRTIVDVLNSQRNLFSAIKDYAQARYDYVLNGLLLKQAAGTLSENDLARVNQWLTIKRD